MSKTFNSWSALKSALQKEVASAMEETATKSFMDVHKNVDAFYSIGGGGAYQRTGQLAESPEIMLLGGGDNYNKLANYLLIDDSLRRYGNYGSLVAYLKSQKVKETA